MLTKVYLDMIWHRASRTVIGCEEFDRQLDRLVKEDKWIINGNYVRLFVRFGKIVKVLLCFVKPYYHIRTLTLQANR